MPPVKCSKGGTREEGSMRHVQNAHKLNSKTMLHHSYLKKREEVIGVKNNHITIKQRLQLLKTKFENNAFHPWQ